MRIAYDQGEVDIQAPVTVRMNGERVETTVGRVLLYEVVPAEIPFREVNRVMKKKELANLIDMSYRLAGNKATVILADRLKDIGYRERDEGGNFDFHQRHGDSAEQGRAAQKSPRRRPRNRRAV